MVLWLGSGFLVLCWAVTLKPSDPMSGWHSCHLRGLYLEVRLQAFLTDSLPPPTPLVSSLSRDALYPSSIWDTSTEPWTP